MRRLLVCCVLCLLQCVVCAAAPTAPGQTPTERPQLVLQLGHAGGRWGEDGACAVSPDLAAVATAGRDGIRLWDPRSGDLLRELEPAGWARVLAWSPDGQTLAAAGDTAALWSDHGRTRRSL